MKKQRERRGRGFFAPLVPDAVSCGKLDVAGIDLAQSFDKAPRRVPQAVASGEMNGGPGFDCPGQ